MTGNNQYPDQPEEMPQLQGLALKAPEDVFRRFRRRSGLIQGGRMLMNTQVSGFWLVLDTVLKIIFKAVPLATPSANDQQTQKTQGTSGDPA